MAASLVEVDVDGCLLRSGSVSGDLICVLPEPDGRLLAPRPGVVRMAFTARIDGAGMAPLGAHAGASRKAAAPVANRTTRLSYWGDDSPGKTPWPVCDFDANGLAVNDRKALAERFIT